MYNSTGDGFLVVGNFNDIGIAAGMIDANLGQIKEMRLNVLKDSENWVILSEVNNFILYLNCILLTIRELNLFIQVSFYFGRFYSKS